MVAILNPHRWLTKPTYSVEVAPNLIADLDLRLFMLYAESGGRPRDCIQDRVGQAVGGAAPWGVGQEGLLVNYNAGSYAETVTRDTRLEPPTATWGCGLRRIGTNGAYAWAMGKTWGNGATNPWISYGIDYNSASGGQNVIRAFCGKSANNYKYSAGSGTAGVDSALPHNSIGRFDGTNCEIFQNGKYVTGQAPGTVGGEFSTLGYDTSSTGNLCIAGSSALAVANQWKGAIYFVFVAGRPWTNAEIFEFGQAPYSILRPRRPVLYFNAGAASSFQPAWGANATITIPTGMAA